MSASQRHRLALDAAVAELTADGYEVFINPGPSLLPSDVKALHIRPDAVALGRIPQILVEVVTSKGNAADDRLHALKETIGRMPDWELLAIYAPSASRDTPIPAQDQKSIATMLDRARAVYDIAGVVPALLSTWSAFEAAARHHMPEVFARPRGATALVDRLASDGVVLPDEADRLRALAKRRDEAAHGRLDTNLDVTELEWLKDLATEMLNRAPMERSAGD